MSFNLHDTKRLIENICVLLRSEGASSSSGEQLAARYAEECRAGNLRLHNCGTMIGNGDSRQALQLANQSPDLLEWVTLLEFFEQEDWKRYCTEKNWECAETINPQDLQELNEVYASGLPVGDPLLEQLLGQYRKAMMTKDIARGLSVLRRINQLNPSDAQMAADLANLDRAVLAQRMQELGQLLQAGTPEQVASAVEEMEKAGFQTPPAGPVWVRAQYARCMLWLGMAEGKRASGRWMETERRLTRIHDTQQAHAFQFTPEEAGQLQELEGWVKAKREKYETQQYFEEQLSQVLHLLEQGEETLATKVRSIQRLRRDREVLYKEWRTLEQFFLPVNAETSQRYRKLMGMMEVLIEQRASHSLWKKVAVVTASFVVLSGLAWGFLSLLGRMDEGQQLDRMRRDRQVSSAKARIEKLRATQSNTPQPGALGEAMAKLEKFITEEEGLLQAYKNRFQGLANQFAPDSERINIRALDQDLAGVKEDLAALAPEFKVAESPALTTFENKWEQFIQKTNSDLNESFEKALQSLETQEQGMAFGQPVLQLKTIVSETSQAGMKLESKKKQTSPKISIKPTLSQRLDAARQRVAEFEKAIQGYDAAVQDLNTAASVEKAQKAIQQLADSKLEAAPEVKHAAAIGTPRIDVNQALVTQLKLSEKQTAYLEQEKPDLTFIPASLLPAEANVLDDLLKSEMITTPLYRLRLRSKSNDRQLLTFLTYGAVKLGATWNEARVLKLKEKKIFKISFWQNSNGDIRVGEKINAALVYDYVSYDLCAETRPYAELALDKKFENNAGYSLLGKLDQLPQKGEGSPLFCAYLYIELAGIAQLRPESWGWSFSPTLQRHVAALKAEAVKVGLENGDWYDEAKVKEHEGKFRKLFSEMATTSYQKEAQAHARLRRLALKEELLYVGYINPTGLPTISSQAAPMELWGHSENGALSLFFEKDSGTTYRPLKPGLRPLTLLFGANKSRADILKESGYNALGADAKKDLPPFFTTTAQ